MMTIFSSSRHAQQGNVLFLILIAVALFAALSYAVTQSTRNGGVDISAEKASLLASQITQYGTSIENAILRMRMSNGCSETDISFEMPDTGYDFTHSPAASDKCKVFHPAGGGIPVQRPADWAETYDPAEVPYALWATGEYGVEQIGTAAPELTISFWGLKKSICNEINKKLGIIYSGSSPPDESPTSQVDFQGTYPGTATDVLGDSGSPLVGHASGCFDAGGGYVYYHVLIPR